MARGACNLTSKWSSQAEPSRLRSQPYEPAAHGIQSSCGALISVVRYTKLRQKPIIPAPTMDIVLRKKMGCELTYWLNGKDDAGASLVDNCRLGAAR